MTARRLRPVAAALAAALVLSACGGGGGGGDAAEAPPIDAGIPVATGVGADQSASQAIAALGSPGPVDPSAQAGTLSGYEDFGTPHDAFAQQVSDKVDQGAEPDTGVSIPADTPINADPLVAVPGDPGAIPGSPAADPGAGAPIQSPRAMEADFDISGEPVVAREGDAIPPDTQQFIVETISPAEVVLKLSGGLLPDGSDTVRLAEGKSLTLYNATAKRTYTIKLVDIRVA